MLDLDYILLKHNLPWPSCHNVFKTALSHTYLEYSNKERGKELG